MQPDYIALQTALSTRLEVISNTDLRDSDPELQLKQLQEVSELIMAWHKENKGYIPSQLNHFLQQCSLSKALDYLQSEGLV